MSEEANKVVDLNEQARVKTHQLDIVIMLPATVVLNGKGEVVTTQVHGANIAAAKLPGKTVKAAQRKEIEKRREQLVIVTLTAATKAIVENYNQRQKDALMKRAAESVGQLTPEQRQEIVEETNKPGLIQKVTGFFSKKE